MKPLREGFAGFEHLVPGWEEQVCEPYNKPIERGLVAAIKRFTGKHYIVATLIREFDYEGLNEELVLDEGFIDPADASEAAQRIGAKRIQKTLAKFEKSRTPWYHLGAPSERWPMVKRLFGQPILSFPPKKVGDGTGFNSREIHMAVFPVDPARPITAELFEAIGHSEELKACFSNKRRPA